MKYNAFYYLDWLGAHSYLLSRHLTLERRFMDVETTLKRRRSNVVLTSCTGWVKTFFCSFHVIERKKGRLIRKTNISNFYLFKPVLRICVSGQTQRNFISLIGGCLLHIWPSEGKESHFEITFSLCLPLQLKKEHAKTETHIFVINSHHLYTRHWNIITMRLN